MNPLSWALVAGGALVAYLTLKKKSPPSGSAPPSVKPGTVPSAATCDDAYASLPPEWEEKVDQATAAASSMGSAEPLLFLADTIEKTPSGIEPGVAKAIVACLRKNASTMGGGTPSMSIPPFMPTYTPAPDYTSIPLPGITAPLPGYSAPSYGGSYKDLGLVPLTYTGEWPALHGLPEPWRSEALNAVSGMMWNGIQNGQIWKSPGASDLPNCGQLFDLKRRLNESGTFAFDKATAQAAIDELSLATNLLYNGGYCG